MRAISLTVLLFLFHAAGAEVTASAANGFELEHEVIIDASRSDVWQAAVGEIGAWWSSAHTLSGDARNMRIDVQPMGCFCETVSAQGSVVHLTVTFVNPGVLLRMTGGLGPLGALGVSGNMFWEFFDADEGTRVKFSYAVGGYHPDGLDSLAPAVDYVIGEALGRLAAYAETGSPDNGER